MTNSLGQELCKKLDVGEVTSWRLHWLLCDLHNLQRDMSTTHFVPRAAQLTEGPFPAMLERLKRIEAAYCRLRWETKTMLGMDYDDEVSPLFSALPKHAEYFTELDSAKHALQRVVDQALENEGQVLRKCIQDSSLS